jgi:DNA-binding protein H-NS
MSRKDWLTSMSIEELWSVRNEVSKLLETRMIAEKQELERRLAALNSAEAKARRPYPPVAPKFANPDEPSQVWSGRGKQPRWVTEKLASGLALQDLSIARAGRLRLMSA